MRYTCRCGVSIGERKNHFHREAVYGSSPRMSRCEKPIWQLRLCLLWYYFFRGFQGRGKPLNSLGVRGESGPSAVLQLLPLKSYLEYLHYMLRTRLKIRELKLCDTPTLSGFAWHGQMWASAPTKHCDIPVGAVCPLGRKKDGLSVLMAYICYKYQ